MEVLAIGAAALLAAALTLFSGFGLGTLLMPVVALFLPVQVAVGVTAVVHLANNLFKLLLVGRNASAQVVVAFGIPALVAAMFGAQVLEWLSDVPPLGTYLIGSSRFQVSAVKAVAGTLILCFLGLELTPSFAGLSFSRRYLSLGGILSGFFGGLSGHQGALRSMFLLKAGLTKESFIATGVVVAVLVDIARLLVYGSSHFSVTGEETKLILVATVSAFLGSFFGARLVSKVTLEFVQRLVSVLLVLVGLGLISGLV